MEAGGRGRGREENGTDLQKQWDCCYGAHGSCTAALFTIQRIWAVPSATIDLLLSLGDKAGSSNSNRVWASAAKLQTTPMGSYSMFVIR